jgi:cold shock CspA family protein
VILARKGAKSRRRITGLRSKTTKARTPVDRLRAANADLKKKLAEALEQQTATSEVLQIKISAEEDYGFIATPDGREIYFHRNSVINNAFDRLSVGSEVRFAEELGEKGAQASTVHLIGKHHLSEQNHRR